MNALQPAFLRLAIDAWAAVQAAKSRAYADPTCMACGEPKSTGLFCRACRAKMRADVRERMAERTGIEHARAVLAAIESLSGKEP